MRQRGFLLRLLSAFSLALMAPTFIAQAYASVVVNNGTLSYPREYFDPFNPQTAQDMIDRLPGFTFDPGEEDLRGFGAGAGNVLIDGARPSSKTGGVEDALARIPANDVERIDVIRNGAGASEASGQAVVANVIRVKNASSARWKASLERSSEGLVYPGAEISFSKSFGAWTTSTKANGFWEQYDLVGTRLSYDSSGALLFSQTEDRPSAFMQVFIATEAKRSVAGGELTLTGHGGYSGFFPVTDRFRFDGRIPGGAPDGRLYIDYDSIQPLGEIGAEWARDFDNGWTIKGVALGSIKTLREKTVTTADNPPGETTSVSTFTFDQTPIETIARFTAARGGERRFRPEFGGEVAYNRLKSALDLATEDSSGNVTIIDLPAANVLVEELRAEPFANLIWKAVPKLTVEAGAAVEISQISVSGDAENQRSFAFLKPSLSLAYDLTDNFQIRAGASRIVSQLDFTDFAASVDAATDQQFGGNPDLSPEHKIRATAGVDWRSERLGALNATLFYEWREDVLGQVRLPSGAFGLANAGSARVWGLESSASLKLAPIIPGGLLEVKATVRDSTYTDPITGEQRDAIRTISPDLTIDFRQDLTERKLSWGVGYIGRTRNYTYFVDELTDDLTGEQWSAFVETTRFKGLKARATLRGVGGRDYVVDRRFFSPDRTGAFTGRELIDRRRGMFIVLSVEGQF